jgi:hypothetical protein
VNVTAIYIPASQSARKKERYQDNGLDPVTGERANDTGSDNALLLLGRLAVLEVRDELLLEFTIGESIYESGVRYQGR